MNTVEKQKAGEAEIDRFRSALGPFVTAADTTRMPMIFMNAKAEDSPIVYVNQSFLDLTGYDEHEIMGESFDFFLKSGTDPEMLEEVRALFRGERNLEPLVRFRRKDRSAIWVLVFITPVRNEAGDVDQYFASFINFTSQKEERDRLYSLLEGA